MTPLRLWLQALLFAAACISALGASGDTGNPMPDAVKPPHGDRLDRAWKRYRNADLGYCVSYPSRWFRGDAFEGTGLVVNTGSHRDSKPTGEIDFGPVDLPGPQDARLKPVRLTTGSVDTTLDTNLEEHLAGLARFVRAERVEVLAQHHLKLQGFNALYAKNRYYDPLEHSTWLEEIVFIERKGQLYRLELQCAPAKIERFEPVFAYLVNTLEFDCQQ